VEENVMKKTWGAGLCAVLWVLSGCAAEEPSDATELAEKSDDLSITGRSSCDLLRCRAGFTCVQQEGIAFCTPTQKRVCETDADCRLVASYCGGCNCLALGSGQSAPKCAGDEVACFVSPCLGQEAFCDDGRCVAEQGPTF
jgi:hypothetical protein